jgi:hypothetical protein
MVSAGVGFGGINCVTMEARCGALLKELQVSLALPPLSLFKLFLKKGFFTHSTERKSFFFLVLEFPKKVFGLGSFEKLNKEFYSRKKGLDFSVRCFRWCFFVFV